MSIVPAIVRLEVSDIKPSKVIYVPIVTCSNTHNIE